MKPKRPKSFAGIIIGAAITVAAPLIGLFGTAHGMNDAFRDLGTSNTGDANALSQHIGGVLHTTLIGGIGGLCGFVILSVSAVCFVIAGQPKQPQKMPQP